MAVQTKPVSRDEDRLHRFTEGEAKYHILPVPAPIDRGTLIHFVNQAMPTCTGPNRMRKLRRLAEFHNLFETAPAFLAVLNRREDNSRENARSAEAIIALAWIGDDTQRNEAHRYLHALMRRCRPEQDRRPIMAACDAFGHREGVDRLKAWIAEDIKRLEAEKAKLAVQGTDADLIDGRINELKSFLESEVADLQAANEIRKDIEATNNVDARIARLVSTYVDDASDSLIDLAHWAALTLIRTGWFDSSLRQKVAAECSKRAQRYAQPGGDMQPEYDVRRARALRAMDFFGQGLEKADADWLVKQKDHGTDELALRPDWEYPRPLLP